MKKDFEPYHVLLVHCHAGALFMTRDPINKVEDFKGMKLRSYSRTNAWILEALGAAPLQVALPELAPMLSKGTVTGSILPYEIAPSVKMQDLTDYFTTLAPPQPRLSTSIFTFLMNKAKYESLPPDLKKVIDDNSGANLVDLAIKTWDQVELDGEKVMHSKPKNKFVQPERRGNRQVQEEGPAGVRPLHQAAGRRRRRRRQDPRRGRGPGGEILQIDSAGRASTPGDRRWLSKSRRRPGRPMRPAGRSASLANVLAIFGGILSCAMAAVVTVSVGGRYLLSAPINGDYDIVGILCGCAIFAFLPYCQLNRGNVLADFFTQKASPRPRPRSMRWAICCFSSPSSCSPGGSTTACSK